MLLTCICWFGNAEAQEFETKPTWESIRAQRQHTIDEYLAQKQVAYRWFADFPFGTEDGIPYLILRVLPTLAPDQWGEGDDFMGVVGLFRDTRQSDYPLPRGIGWSGLARDPSESKPDFASFACGACHVGRLRKDDGSLVYLDGGINSEFNVVAYRTRVKATLDRVTRHVTSLEQRVNSAKEAILHAIEDKHASDPHFFYRDYVFGQRFDREYEANQIRLFRANADALITKFLVRMDLEVNSLSELIKKNYRGFEQPMLHGFGGMADATGVSTSFGFVFARDIKKDKSATPETRLPPTPGLTDFMAVWEQRKRKVRWDRTHTQLIDGGGQWNGNIPLPIFRNLAAELTMGFGEETDVRVATFGQDLLVDLPAPPYPFDVDLELAAKGEKLFRTNCRDCHRPNNGRVYDNLGTDLGRATVVTKRIAVGARKGFTAIGAPNRVVVLPPTGERRTPFGEFEGVTLADKPELAMRDPDDCRGYNALPLGGIWAQAPYLHTGSVPTLYHLLMPDERPDRFTKSRLEYDSKHVGFRWTAPDQDRDSKGYVFDTKAFPSITKRGHDRDIYEDGNRYQLDWSDDPDGAWAIIEYMKTL